QPGLLFVWARRAAMWLLPSLAWALLSPVLATELSWQESSLLKSLGLSAKPSPKSPVPVPPVLWRIFQKRKTLPRPDKELDPCRVEEFNVPGNIVRVFADQGTGAPRLGLSLGSSLGSAPSSPVPGAAPGAGFQEKSLLREVPLDAAGDDLWVWSPEAG
ncbi:GDF3 factor, partial [Melanocharis versteri]|nr:GDF3 factor [Melanocharis versteri]